MPTTSASSVFRTFAVIAASLAASMGAAQPRPDVPERPGWLLMPAFRVAPVFEDNVLFTPAPRNESWLLRVTPRLDAIYRRGSRTFEAGYNFDAERYPSPFETLDDVFARQEANAELRTLLNRRSSLVLRGSFLSTSRPEEVLRDIGLIGLRRRSRSVVANAQFTRAVTRRLNWTAGYAYSLRDFERPEGLAPRLGGTMHSFVTGLAFRHSVRTTSSWNYGLRWFIREELPEPIAPTDDFISHVATYRFSRALSRRVDLTLSLGPRFSEGLRASESVAGEFERARDLAPEAFASIAYRGDGTFFSAQYTRTQSQAYGLSGFVDTQNAIFTALFELGPRFRIEANPGIFRNRRAGISTNSYQADVTARYRFSEWAALETGYLFQYQDRLLAIIDGDVTATDAGITRNTVLFGIELSKVYAPN